MDSSLQNVIVDYLISKGWYFDEALAKDFEWIPKEDRIREAPAWTVPQWEEYWMKPYSDDPNHKNFGAPKSRRYEDLKQAVWSQLLREEKPETFEPFFQIGKKS